jgi:hypothetical protein
MVLFCEIEAMKGKLDGRPSLWMALEGPTQELFVLWDNGQTRDSRWPDRLTDNTYDKGDTGWGIVYPTTKNLSYVAAFFEKHNLTASMNNFLMGAAGCVRLGDQAPVPTPNKEPELSNPSSAGDAAPLRETNPKDAIGSYWPIATDREATDSLKHVTSPLWGPAPSTKHIVASSSSKMFFEAKKYKEHKDMKDSQFKPILDKCEAVLLERERQFKGSADGMFSGIAAVASDLCGNHHESADVAAVLLALKIERMKANPQHEDSLVDCVNYLMFFHKELLKLRG